LEPGADLVADANDDVGIAGSEVADGEVHSPQHAHLHQPDEMVQHGGFPLLHHQVLSLPRSRRRSSRLLVVSRWISVLLFSDVAVALWLQLK